MALRLHIAPSIEPVTLAEARKHLRIDAPSLTTDLVPDYSLTPASRNAGTATGTAVDVLGHEVLVILEAGICTGAGTLDVHIEDSDDDTTYANVTSGAFTQVKAANDEDTFTLAYTGGKRYLRAVAVVAAAACTFGVTVVTKGATDTEDTVIEGLITAARQWIEERTHRALISQTWTLYLEDWPSGDSLKLPKGNLQTINSVAYLDTDGDSTPMTVTTDYIADTYSEPARLMLAYGASWPSATLYPSNPIAIEFECGYGAAASTVPNPLKQAILLLVGHWYVNREAVLTGSISKEIEFTVTALLAPYILFGAEW